MKKIYFSFVFVLVFCFTFLVGCKKYEVSYINDNLINDGFISSTYERRISSDETVLFEEVILSERADEAYLQSVSVRELNLFGEYIETSEERSASEEELKINLVLKEEYFNPAQLKISKNSLIGKLRDDMVLEALGISSASNVSIDVDLVSLNDSLRVKSISIYYTDLNYNYKVSIKVNYEYAVLK